MMGRKQRWNWMARRMCQACMVLFSMCAQAQVETDSVVASRQLSEDDRAATLDADYIQRIEEMIDSVERQRQLDELLEAREQLMTRHELSFHTDGALEVLGALASAWSNKNFVDRSGSLKAYDTDAVDYLPAFSPLAATYALKALGVQSRSSNRRFWTANAGALLLANASVHLLKNIVSERRPDGTDDHSLPSGHAAMAFVSASILHREYGHISPWISVAGYSAATATEYLRMRHHDHYGHDLALGAGIGMISTNLAYYISSRIFGPKSVNKYALSASELARVDKFAERPSSFALLTGAEVGGRHALLEDFDGVRQRGNLITAEALGTGRVYSSTPLLAGVEGTYAFTPCWQGQVSVLSSSALAKLSLPFQTPWVGGSAAVPADWQGDDLQLLRAHLTLSYSMPVSLNQRISLRTLCGVRHREALDFRLAGLPESSIHVPAATKMEWGGGIGVTVMGMDHFLTGVNVDYLHTFGDVFAKRCVITTFMKILL